MLNEADIQPQRSSNKIVWRAFVLLLSISIVIAALSAGMVRFFEKIRIIIPELVGVVCIMGIVISYLFVRKRPVKQMVREMLIVSINYLIVVIAALIHPIGFISWILCFFIFCLVFIINNNAKNVPSSLLLNANSVFSMTMSVTFGGLLYARNISADWGTLYVTFLAGMIYVIVGFVIATIILFSVDHPKNA